MKFRLIFPILLGAISSLRAASIPLNSTMNGNSYMGETVGTGGFSRINMGDGRVGTAGYIFDPQNPNYANSGDRDGHYRRNGVGNPATFEANNTPNANGQILGSGWDLFPRETNFQFGSLTYNEAGFTGIGTETFSIQSFDLSAFWTSDPNRTNGAAGSLPTVISDISDHALGLWLFNGAGGISFGALDANDTVTFTNGQLTSINLQVATTFSLSVYGAPLNYTGIFEINGNNISYLVDGTQNAPFVGATRFAANLTGTVNAVVPEPSSVALLALAGSVLGFRRIRRVNG